MKTNLLHGGSFYSFVYCVRCAYRNLIDSPRQCGGNVGFRPVIAADPAKVIHRYDLPSYCEAWTSQVRYDLDELFRVQPIRKN